MTRKRHYIFALLIVVTSVQFSMQADAQSLQPVQLQSPSMNEIRSIQFSPDGKRVACTGGVFAEVWNADTGEKMLTLDHTVQTRVTLENGVEINGFVASAAFSPNGRYVVTGAAPLIATLWDTFSGEQIHAFQLENEDLLIPAQAAFSAVGFSPDGKQLLTTANIPETHLWDAETGEHIRFLFHRGGAERVTMLQDRKRVLLIGENSFFVYSVDTGDLLFRRDGWSPAISPDENLAYVHLGDEGIYVYAMLTGELESVNKNPPFPDVVRTERPELAIAPNGKYVILGRENPAPEPTRLYRLDSASQSPIRTFVPDGLASSEDTIPKDIVISPDSRKAAILYSSNTVFVYDLRDLETGIPDAYVHRQ